MSELTREQVRDALLGTKVFSRERPNGLGGVFRPLCNVNGEMGREVVDAILAAARTACETPEHRETPEEEA